jgi:hypothetical protein
LLVALHHQAAREVIDCDDKNETKAKEVVSEQLDTFLVCRDQSAHAQRNSTARLTQLAYADGKAYRIRRVGGEGRGSAKETLA